MAFGNQNFKKFIDVEHNGRDGVNARWKKENVCAAVTNLCAAIVGMRTLYLCK